MDHVDAKHQRWAEQGPGTLGGIQRQRLCHGAQLQVRRPGGEAGAMGLERIAALPAQLGVAGGKALLEMAEMLTTATGDLQHQTGVGQQGAQHLRQGFTVAFGGWEPEPRIHGSLKAETVVPPWPRGSGRSNPGGVSHGRFC